MKKSGFNNKKFFFIGGIGVLVLLVIIIVFLNRATIKKPTVEEIFLCDEDSDCVKVKAGCCSCYNGGKAIAINKIYEENYDNNLFERERCDLVDCITQPSDDPSCFATPKCVNNKCELINE